MPQALRPDSPWYVQAFDRNWLRLYAHRNDAEAAARAPELSRLLRVRAGQRVLDVGCGAGRYCRALAARGVRMTGVDLSRELIEVARERSPSLPGTPQYHRGDVRSLPFFQQFEGAISMFTSFGYFDERSDDLRIFRGVHRALIPGGRFVIDFLNEAQVRATLVAEEERHEETLRVTIRRRIEDTPAGAVVRKQVVARDGGSGRLITSFEERVRLYTADEVDALLRDADFELVGVPMGDVDGRPLTPDAPRLVRVAQRP